MTSPSRSGADLRALCLPFHPTREYLEHGPHLSTQTQAEIQRYREFNRPIVPTSSGFDNRYLYRETDIQYPRRPSSVYHLQPVAGDSWRRYDQDDSPTSMLHGEWRPSVSSQYESPPIRYPYSKPVLPPIQPQYPSYSHSEPSIQPLHPFLHCGSSPRLYSLSQNPLYSRPGASPRPQQSSYSYNRPSPQTYRPLHHERSPPGQHSYFSPSGPSAQPQYSSLQVGSSSNLPISSHSRAGPSSWRPFSSYSQPMQSSPLPYSSQPRHPSSYTGSSSWLPDSSYLEPGASQRPDPSYLQLRPSVSPYVLPPPLALNPSRRPDIRSLLSDPLDQSEAQERSPDWLLQEAQRRGIDVKAILISHLFPKSIPSSNQAHILRGGSPTKNCKRYLSDCDSDASPGNSKRREIASLNDQRGRDRNENLSDLQSSSYGIDVTGEPASTGYLRPQPTRTRTTLSDSDSTLSGSERDGTESGKESARNDESDRQGGTICGDQTIILDKGDENSKYRGSARQDESTSVYEGDRNPSYDETRSLEANSNHGENSTCTGISNQIESSTHDDSIHHTQNATHNITTGGSKVEELPVFRQTKAKGKRKFYTLLGSDDCYSGPSSSKRPKTRSYVETVRHNENRHESSRSSGSKDGLQDYNDNSANGTPDTTPRTNNANMTSRGLPVPLRRSSRNSKTRIRSS